MLLAGVAVALVSQSAAAEIYRWQDEYGRVHFGDRAPAQQRTQQVELGKINTYSAPSAITLEQGVPAAPRRVVMYTAPWCGVCKTAKRFLKDLGIRYTEYDIEKSSRARRKYNKLGARGVPVILVGRQRMNGFSAARMKTMLRNAGYPL
jgi:glutaredoxin